MFIKTLRVWAPVLIFFILGLLLKVAIDKVHLSLNPVLISAFYLQLIFDLLLMSVAIYTFYLLQLGYEFTYKLATAGLGLVFILAVIYLPYLYAVYLPHVAILFSFNYGTPLNYVLNKLGIALIATGASSIIFSSLKKRKI